ncbi:transposase [Nocardia gamkensis]|uniref:transposase n=1 Tax=Nocardia gamkensis TaxID=352869 RepID=UPI0036EAB69E
MGRHTGVACFADACACCPLRAQCTTAAGGRTITIGAYEHYLATARERRDDPVWKPTTAGSAQSGTQNRSSDAPPPRRTPGPDAWTGQDRRRFRPAGRRGQSRPTRGPGHRPHHWRLDRSPSLTKPGYRTRQAKSPQSQPGTTRYRPSPQASTDRSLRPSKPRHSPHSSCSTPLT